MVCKEVIHRPYPKCLPKVFSDLLLNQMSHLPVFFPKLCSHPREPRLHILDVLKALSFYLDRTKSFNLLEIVAFAGRMKGQAVSTQRASGVSLHSGLV